MTSLKTLPEQNLVGKSFAVREKSAQRTCLLESSILQSFGYLVMNFFAGSSTVPSRFSYFSLACLVHQHSVVHQFTYRFLNRVLEMFVFPGVVFICLSAFRLMAHWFSFLGSGISGFPEGSFSSYLVLVGPCKLNRVHLPLRR